MFSPSSLFFFYIFYIYFSQQDSFTVILITLLNCFTKAATGDYLRIWEIKDNSIHPLGSYVNRKCKESCAPLTSFDWNPVEFNKIATASIDTTCTVWDIEAKKEIAQIAVHEKEVYDISYGVDKDVFATVGGDGSLRLFDIRSSDFTKIVFCNPSQLPLLRTKWSKTDPNYIATFGLGDNFVSIIDLRNPSAPAIELKVSS